MTRSRYSPASIAWARPIEPHDEPGFELLTGRQRALCEPPNSRYGGREVPFREWIKPEYVDAEILARDKRGGDGASD